MNCPVCGDPLDVREWHEDGWLVEVKWTCQCGYVYHWSYGAVVEDGGDAT